MGVRNLGPSSQAKQERRSAEIIDFLQRLPPGPRPYDPQEYALMMEAAEIARRNTERLREGEIIAMARPKNKQQQPGTVGAERVAPDFEPERWRQALSHQPFLLLTTCLTVRLGFNKFNGLASRQARQGSLFLPDVTMPL
jgi:hypothetical protein